LTVYSFDQKFQLHGTGTAVSEFSKDFSNRFTIAFVYENPSSFVMQDLQILSHVFRVVPFRWTGIASVGRLLQALLYSDIVFVWWTTGRAAMAAFVFAKVLRKVTVFVAGGSDVSPEKEIHGSDPRSAIRFLFAKVAIRLVDCVVAVSQFTMRDVFAISKPKRFAILYHGIDTRAFSSSECEKDIVLTVVARSARDYLWRKGLDRFLNVASLLPNRKFVLAGEGGTSDLLRHVPMSNVTVTGKLNELIPLFQRARFYCQLSRHEGFGVAVAEAMACRCVPVVSDAGALPELVGDCGVVVPNGDAVESAEAIERLWNQSDRLGTAARSRIVVLCPLERRISGLTKLFANLRCV